MPERDVEPLFNSRAVPIAKAALIEAGRPDLAARVEINRAGWPMMAHTDSEHDVIVRAFWLGHVSSGHRAHIGVDDESGLLCIDCVDCWESYA